ncbi:MAG TPA: adenylate/guanylate cyclase domain-containing protein [Anaeromyxobacteraceae bacterium]|nr:adenylate/guanylate cyclase domain-containing protein [Anaeromyxobacteraceae bacterium]
MRTENLAVMFTDIEGFTARTSRQTHEENALLLRRHDALLTPVVRAFGGRHVKSIGDAWLVVFSSPTSSVLCGMAIQDRLWDFNRRVTEDERIRVRVAVNLGEVRVARSVGASDVFGEPVNIAARVEGEAQAGEVLFTEAVYLAMNKAEAPAEEVGYRELKGLSEPIRLYRAVPGPVALTSARAASPDAVEQPPFGNHALARVKGLEPPDPAEVLRQGPASADLADLAGRLGRAGAKALPQLAGHLGRAGAAFPRRGRIAAAVAGGLLVLTVAWILVPSRPERLIDAGRLDEARAAIEALESRRGQEDDEVLYLQARLEEERWHRGQTGPREAFRLYGRALGAGSAAAARALARQGESTECGTRRLAARALSDSHSRKAISALRDIAAGEEAEPEAKDAIDKVRRIFGGGGRCGAGDVARDGLRALEEGS